MKLCAACIKNRRAFCPHNFSAELAREIAPRLKQEIFGPTPPNIFVGHNFYPKVYAGPTVAVGEVKDSPADWYGMDFGGIIRQRALQVQGRRMMGIKPIGKIIEQVRESIMSIKPIDVEVRFSKVPKFEISYDEVHSPAGPSAPIERLEIADNPRIPKKVDEIVQEGVLAAQAVGELALGGFDNYYITKLLTAGVLGRKAEKKLVPTKWGITATDDMLGKGIMEKIREMPQANWHYVYSNEYLHNHFEVLLMPGAWEYEQFETMVYANRWGDISEEYEPYWGRSDYASRQGGGYYAARLGVVEGLQKLGRQARAVLFREIGEGYAIPCGVWEVRENVRHAFLGRAEKFGSLKEALGAISGRLKISMKEYEKKSRILKQSRLTDY